MVVGVRGVLGSPTLPCRAVVAGLSQARAPVTTLLTVQSALPTPPTIFTPNLPLAPGSLVIREGWRRRGGRGGHCERGRMVPIVRTAGPESAASPGESIAIWAELAAKSFFLGCSCAQKEKKKSIPPAKIVACAMCQRAHAACASVRALTYRQSNCSFSIVPLPSSCARGRSAP